MRIECVSCGSRFSESTVEDMDADQCPDCGEYTSFEPVDDADGEEGDGEPCSECGGPLGELELSNGYDICFACLTGESGE